MLLPITQNLANINNYLGPQKNLFNYGWSEASTFSLLAYKNPEEQKPLPTGWTELIPVPANLQSNGYYGDSYYRCESGKQGWCMIAIAHRGTDEFFWDSLADFKIFFGKVPYDYYMNALFYFNYVVEFVEDNFPGYPGGYGWTVTGHSLGAVLAELNTYPFPPYYHDGTIAMVFDSPGLKEIVKSEIDAGDLPADALDFITQHAQYDFSGANAINTWNTQLSPPAVNREFSSEDFKRVFPVPPDYANPPDPTYYALVYSPNQHHMINFYNRWHSSNIQNQEPSIPNAFIWPIGFAAGYKTYLSYSLHPDYWNGMIDYIWQNWSAVYIYYGGDKAKYKQAVIDHLQNGVKPLNVRLTSESAHPERVLQKDSTSPQKLVIPEKYLKKMTLEDVLNNNLDGYGAERKQIYAKADNDKKLYYAVVCDDAVLAEKLMRENHANPNTQHGERHYSLLQIAIISGDLDVVKVLLKYGANPELTDSRGDTALHTAARERYEDAYLYAKELVKANTKNDVKNKEEKTALMLAEEHCARCSAQIAEDAKKNMVLAGQKTWCQTMCGGEFAKTLEK